MKPKPNRKRKRSISSPSRRRVLRRTGQPVGRSRNRRTFAGPVRIRTGTGPVSIPLDRSVGVVVTAMNEEGTIGKVLGELNRLPLHEVIVVINGSTDGTYREARQAVGPNGLILHYPEPLGYDVGRAVGARAAQSDILLFLDGDFAVPAEQLVPFILAVGRGADVALNNLKPYGGMFAHRDDVSMMKEFLNRSLGRAELGMNSMTAVPHALSRKAVETIGYARLAVPPLAQAAAIRNGLKMTSPGSVNVYRSNRVRQQNTGERNPVARMIVGDHLEALIGPMESEGSRLGYPDGIRKRAFAAGVQT